MLQGKRNRLLSNQRIARQSLAQISIKNEFFMGYMKNNYNIRMY